MPEIVGDCPRCGSSKVTLDVHASNATHRTYSWQNHYEFFCVCRLCLRGSIFRVSDSVDADYNAFHKVGPMKVTIALNNFVRIDGYVTLKDRDPAPAPEGLPDGICQAFLEGARCIVASCPNAAGTMFRLALDLATREKLPPEGEEHEGLNARVKRDLGLRLPWLFANRRLPEDLEELSHCVKEDGNDGAHRGTLTREDAEDLQDFARLMLERIYGEKARLMAAAARREARRAEWK